LQAEPQSYLALVRVEFGDGGVERYFLPLAYKSGDDAAELIATYPRAAVAWLGGPSGRLLLHDATADGGFWLSLYRASERNWRGRSLQGLYSAAPTPGTPFPPSLKRRSWASSRATRRRHSRGWSSASSTGSWKTRRTPRSRCSLI
jgi:hypothetical protein